MKYFKNVLFTIGIALMLMLSIQPIKIYDDSWMIYSYFFHMCMLFIYLIWGSISQSSTSHYRLGAHCSTTVSLMLLSTYPFFLTSEKITDLICKYLECCIEPYEGGVLVTLCILLSEIVLFAFLYNWIDTLKLLKKTKELKTFSFVLGILVPFFMIIGYTSNLYMNYYTKEKIRIEAQIIEINKENAIKFRNDSINKELAQKYVNLSFGNYQLGDSISENKEEPTLEYLLNEKIENIKLENHNGVVYKIIVSFRTTSSKFIQNAIELYTQKYGETGTYGKWYFKNCSISIEKVATYTETRPVQKQRTVRRNRLTYTKEYTDKEKINHYTIIITYTDHKIDSIVKQEKALEEQQIKENEELKKAQEREKERQREIEMEKQKQREYEMI